MPQLDALRAFAVILVLFHHWLPEKSLLNYLPTGPMGVTLFFVLSGYLISRILLQNRNDIDSRLQTPLTVIKLFYIRRSLRIFPIYFIVIFICLTFNVENIEDMFVWFLTYSSNILHFQSGQWAGALSHLWTLAVEEQYYLVIPFVLIFVPGNYLKTVIWFLILVGPLTRCMIFFLIPTDHPEILTSVLTFSAMDCFGIGTLLAYVRVNGSEKANERFDMYLWSFFILASVGFLFMVAWGNDDLTSLGLRSLFSVISLYLIDGAAKGVKGKLKVLLENRVILYLGKISYGIYLFHMFMPYIWKQLDRSYQENEVIQYINQSQPFLLFLIFFVVTLAIASFSWFCIEKPINDLKRFFEYGKQKQVIAQKLLSPQLNVGLLLVVLIFLYPQVQSIHTKDTVPDKEKPKLLMAKTSGIYISDFNKITTDTSYTLPSDLPFDFDMVSLYIAWGDKESFDLPTNQIKKLEQEGKQIFITWEPWTATFSTMKLDNREVYKAVCQGKLDSFLKRQAELLKSVEGPLYIRWAHNADKIDCPWSAITEKEIDYCKRAHAYIQKFFDKHAAGKIKWVWPSPGPSRIEDYFPDDYRMDYIGCPGVNNGKDKSDEQWREFQEIYERYERQFKKLKALDSVPVFITEVGMNQRSKDEREWFANAFRTIKDKNEIKHCVVFVFNEAVLANGTLE